MHGSAYTATKGLIRSAPGALLLNPKKKDVRLGKCKVAYRLSMEINEGLVQFNWCSGARFFGLCVYGGMADAADLGSVVFDV